MTREMVHIAKGAYFPPPRRILPVKLEPMAQAQPLASTQVIPLYEIHKDIHYIIITYTNLNYNVVYFSSPH